MQLAPLTAVFEAAVMGPEEVVEQVRMMRRSYAGCDHPA